MVSPALTTQSDRRKDGSGTLPLGYVLGQAYISQEGGIENKEKGPS